MCTSVNTRSYDSSKRRAAALQTRHAILTTAHGQFVKSGYQKTTMAAIAEAAGVAVDTIYATIGTKSQLFQALIEAAISGEDAAIPALERDYVRALRAEADPEKKLALYASAIRHIHERLAPLIRVLQEASVADEELALLWHEISERRAQNMQLFAAELAESGKLRQDLSIDQAADIIWATNAPEFYSLLVHERGWSGDRFETFLADAWNRLLLEP